jgi:hypothetical protein
MIYRHKDSIVVMLPDGRNTLTTSWVGGGYREDLQAIFNHHVPRDKKSAKELEGGSIHAYLDIISTGLGLDPERSSGLLTAAGMENASIVTRSFRGVEVTAVVTAGVEINGGRGVTRPHTTRRTGHSSSYRARSTRYFLSAQTCPSMLWQGLLSQQPRQRPRLCSNSWPQAVIHKVLPPGPARI